ncbi:MAG: NAD(P)/FAD-dependent oxidoreductase [Gammaproteobacteria bacterium]|nr:NAD(P)/FAD-dependent oxidoreductase [Gammaproteobacteria bacterium]
MNTNSAPEVVIIGAGFAGLMMAISLRQQGIGNFKILEGAAGVGGCWRTNTYPGCACDIPSHLYSFAQNPNPNWSRAFSSQSEIKQYIEHCAEKYNLLDHIVFNKPVTRAEYNAQAGNWSVTTQDGETINPKVLLQCTGGLSLPKYPNVEGRNLFQGRQVHTAHWDNDLDLVGKRVVVVGTGASAIQVIPAIADQVDRLYVLQHSPAWVLPKRDKIFTDKERSDWQRAPWTQRLERRILYWLLEMTVPALLWFPSLLKFGKNEHKKALARDLSDPQLRQQLTPNYQLGCKRTLISDDYFSTFNKPHVTLVPEELTRLSEHGIEVGNGEEFDVDVVIYATGYQTGAPAYPFELIGSNGQDIQDYWNGVPKAFYGMTISHFPNFGMIMGPNSGPGHTSVLIYQEAQAKYLARYVKHIRHHKLHSMDLRETSQSHFFQRMQRRMRRSTWSSGCESWYLNADGTNSSMWPGFSVEFILALKYLWPNAYNEIKEPTLDQRKG